MDITQRKRGAKQQCAYLQEYSAQLDKQWPREHRPHVRAATQALSELITMAGYGQMCDEELLVTIDEYIRVFSQARDYFKGEQ